MSRYARGIANLRDIGVTREDLTAYTTEPRAVMYPMQAVQAHVYANPQLTGSAIDDALYTRCVLVSYQNMLTELRSMERVRQQKLQEELYGMGP